MFRINKFDGEDGWLACVIARLEVLGYPNFVFSDIQIDALREHYSLYESPIAIAEAITDPKWSL